MCKKSKIMKRKMSTFPVSDRFSDSDRTSIQFEILFLGRHSTSEKDRHQIIRMKSGTYLHRPLNRIGEDLGGSGDSLHKVDPRVNIFKK